MQEASANLKNRHSIVYAFPDNLSWVHERGELEYNAAQQGDISENLKKCIVAGLRGGVIPKNNKLDTIKCKKRKLQQVFNDN